MIKAMIVILTEWYQVAFLAAITVAFVEVCLRMVRIGKFHPEIRTCSWSKVPGIVWSALIEDRIHLFEMLRGLRCKEVKPAK